MEVAEGCFCLSRDILQPSRLKSKVHRAQERGMPLEDAELPFRAGDGHLFDDPPEGHLLRGHDFQCQFIRHLNILRLFGKPLRLFHDLFDPADHVEGLLGQVIVLAIENFLEASDRVGHRDELALRTR